MADQLNDLPAKLSPRMCECLRLVYERKSSKEIARILKPDGDPPMSPGTVDGYIADAVRLLGAANRRDAAERLFAYEQRPPRESHPQTSGVGSPGDSPSDERPWRSIFDRASLPIRTKGASHNDLYVRQRIAWICIIAFGIALGIGAVANVLRFVDELARHR